ncbi:DUF4142 domain-containing protein [Streptomyces sp. NPDC006339]|uniref:DUF4142 domain-containing protein n=1 Tax=Streptomyces sp. NPDC006339 TaxID=3156755 RepID=UPI0033BCDA58
MKSNRLATVAALLVATCAIAVPQAAAAQVGDQDATFLKSAHQGNLAEIAAGRDAQKNGISACVQEVGRVLVRDHTKLDADGKALAAKLGVALPAEPTAEQKAELAAVRAKAGTSGYDAAWLTAQDAAHTKTLALIDTELASGDDSEVKAAARAARPVVAMHLDMVRGGVCHAAKHPGTVKAGSGGHLAASDDARTMTGVAALAGGGVLAALGGVWFVRDRRTRRAR